MAEQADLIEGRSLLHLHLHDFESYPDVDDVGIVGRRKKVAGRENFERSDFDCDGPRTLPVVPTIVSRIDSSVVIDGVDDGVDGYGTSVVVIGTPCDDEGHVGNWRGDSWGGGWTPTCWRVGCHFC